ncbi:hypothetical protein Tco_0831278, partial [Tanacetum coccineum]
FIAKICRLPWSCVFLAKLPYQVGDVEVCIFPRSSFPMANFATKYSIMTQEMVDSFCDSFYISAEVHPTAPGRDKTITQFPVGKVDMGLLDFIKTADPRNVRAVEVQKGDDQVKLLESTQHCFMPLVIPAAGSCSATAAEIPTPTEGGQEEVAEEGAYLELADPNEGTAMVRQSEEEVITEQSKKVKKRRLQKQSDVLPAKKLRADHPALVSGAGGFLDSSARTNHQICTTMESSSALGIPVDTTAAAITSIKAAATTKLATDVNLDLAGPSHPEESEGSDDSFYAPTTLDPSKAKRWYVPRWSITNDSLLDDGFSCRTLVDRVAPPAFFSALRSMDYDQLYTEFNVGAARQSVSWGRGEGFRDPEAEVQASEEGGGKPRRLEEFWGFGKIKEIEKRTEAKSYFDVTRELAHLALWLLHCPTGSSSIGRISVGSGEYGCGSGGLVCYEYLGAVIPIWGPPMLKLLMWEGL